MWAVRVVAVALVVTATAPTEGADPGTVTAPKLDALERSGAAAPATKPDAALPLPATVTICQDTAAQQCWSAHGTGPCASDMHPDARVFQHVASNVSPGDALAACWDELRAPKRR
jgi:hypothetical protein